MAQEHGIDTKHVFVLGYSNGGQMAFRMAIETPDEVAAVAALGASLPTPDSSSCAQVDSLTWSSGDHTPIAVLYTVHGGGHVVPQPAFRYPRMLGRTAGDLDAPSSALQFFGLSQ
jgi:poly(3-hydroxybutyrate) depolymerase